MTDAPHGLFQYGPDATPYRKLTSEGVRVEAAQGAVVLLSPACASFDQFANFEARGDAFRQLVAELRRGGGPAA